MSNQRHCTEYEVAEGLAAAVGGDCDSLVGPTVATLEQEFSAMHAESNGGGI